LILSISKAHLITPMPNIENIEGNKLLSIFQQLISQKILVKVFLPKFDYESLTLVTDTQDEGTLQLFKIDAPKGLNSTLADPMANCLSFEFTSTDHVIHRFDADILAISDDSITLRYPLFIQRHQQRDNFRVRVPHNSYALVTMDETQIRMEIENISLGGVYCYCRNKYKSIVSPDHELADMQLVLTLKNECCIVLIERVQLRRMESRTHPRHFGVAFEFIQMKRDAKKQLVQQIYELQRVFLKNRLKIMP
jgi:c-di-GMP-binding flagellar brake protein YcgR